MAIPPLVALEIGTAKVVAVVGEPRAEGHIEIIGMGEYPSSGVRKGEIIHFDNALVCVRSALQLAEESAQVEIGRVHVAVSGGHIQSLVNRGTVRVTNPDGEITEEDVSRVMGVAKTVTIAAEREILHTICQHFYVDDHPDAVRPIGMEGSKLALDMLVLHGVRARLHNPARLVRSVPLDFADIVFGGICSGLAVLTPEQKESGALVIDLGAGTTDYVAYAGGRLATAGSLAIGGDHVTNDIAMGFKVSSRQAEHLKRQSGSAVIDVANRLRQVTVPAEVGFQDRTFTMAALHTVINARMEELLGMVRSRLTGDDLQQIGAGVVLTGGGAHMRGVCELAERVFRLPCTVGRAYGVSGLAEVTENPEYAAAVGLIRYGARTVSREPAGPLTGVFRKLFGRWRQAPEERDDDE